MAKFLLQLLFAIWSSDIATHCAEGWIPKGKALARLPSSSWSLFPNIPGLSQLRVSSTSATSSGGCQSGKTSSARKFVNPRLTQCQREGLLVPIGDQVLVLGTVHIGSESAKDVLALLDEIQPSHVVVELAPSRWKRIQATHEQKDSRGQLSSPPLSLGQAISLFPGVVERGWELEQAMGWFVCARLIWPSLVRKALTSQEEAEILPRVDEFVTAGEWALENKKKIHAADMELNQIISNICRQFNHSLWNLISKTTQNGLSQFIGLQPKDPLHRRQQKFGKKESILEWAARRRKLETVRASRLHEQHTSPEMATAMVDSRDDCFVQAAQQILLRTSLTGSNVEEEELQESSLCIIVGLAHLDGVVEKLENVWT